MRVSRRGLFGLVAAAPLAASKALSEPAAPLRTLPLEPLHPMIEDAWDANVRRYLALRKRVKDEQPLNEVTSSLKIDARWFGELYGEAKQRKAAGLLWDGG